MMRAPLRLESGRLVLVKAAEPAKKTVQALEKLSSSTGWITAASPPASVRVPAAVSSSSRRKSEAAKRLSSSRDFSSAPRRDEAPAMTIRRDSRGIVMGPDYEEAVRETKRWRKKRMRCNVTPVKA